MHNVWLHRYTVVVAICTLLLVVAGGLVTSNDAGLSVPGLAQLFFSTTVLIALFTSAEWKMEMPMVEDSSAPSLHALASAVPVCVLAQLAPGAAAPHQALGVLPHVIGASVVTGMILWIVLRVLVTS